MKVLGPQYMGHNPIKMKAVGFWWNILPTQKSLLKKKNAPELLTAANSEAKINPFLFSKLCTTDVTVQRAMETGPWLAMLQATVASVGKPRLDLFFFEKLAGWFHPKNGSGPLDVSY